MANYQKVRAKLTNTKLNNLKPAAKKKTGTILRLNRAQISKTIQSVWSFGSWFCSMAILTIIIVLTINLDSTAFFSRKNLPRIRNRGCAINVNDRNSKATHWFSSFIDGGRAVDFDSFGIEYIPR